MSETQTGGCLCGGVRYSVSGPMRDVVACHCIQCRKTSGHYVAATRVAQSDFSIDRDETLVWFRSSDKAKRGFCSRCGGNLFWWLDEGDQVSIFAGTLDGPTGLKIAEHIHMDTKGDYYDILGRF